MNMEKWAERADIGNERQLDAWVKNAKAGDVAAYHVGDHLWVVKPGTVTPVKRPVAMRALAYSDSGHVQLYQMRCSGPRDGLGFEYLAVRTAAYTKGLAA